MISTIFRFCLVLVVGSSLTACSSSRQEASHKPYSGLSSQSTPQKRTLTLLHTNDMHASFLPHEATWMKGSPKPLVGGFKELEFKIDSIRKSKQNVLLFDGGDVMTGNPISDMMYKDAEGGALYEMMNMLNYDAACLGNHEFDISQENVHKLMRVARFPIMSANLVNANN